MSHDGVGLRAVMRSVAFLTAGALAVPALTACSSEDAAGKPVAGQDIAPASRDLVADGGTLHWAVDAVPETLNTFQADADSATSRVVGAVLPSMYRLDRNGRPQINPDYLESAKVVETEPKQVVLYKLNQQAVWSDGREIGAADFAAQWRALSGKDTAYWTARNAGYDRIEKIERGKNNLEVRVTFSRPYADWKSLFSPLYPKDVMGTPDTFNDGARRKLKVTAGPFALKNVNRKDGEVRLTRNPRWWGRPTKLAEIDLVAVPRAERATALAAGKLDLAEIAPSEAERITLAGQDKGSTPLQGPGATITPAKALRSWARAYGSDDDAAGEETQARKKRRKAIAKYAGQQSALSGFVVRKSLEPIYTQLALNGSGGPLADERVRRAVARALDRQELAQVVLKPLGLPAVPVGSHLALSGQQAYADNSGALGGQDTAAAQALLTDAGWVPGGPVTEQKPDKAAGSQGKGAGSPGGKADSGDGSGDDGRYIVGEDNKPGEADREKKKDPKDHTGQHKNKHSGQHADEQAGKHLDGKQYSRQGGAQGAYAPQGTAAPAGAAANALAKDGKPLTLRFVVPSGTGSEPLRAVADRIAQMLQRIGIRTELNKVSDDSYFKDHIASGQYDLALYSWPASAFPATDARPIFAKPVPAADGSLSVEQNYTRVGTDQVDQLFDQAISTLDEDEERALVRKADARIWAAAGSIPLYQRPQLTAARTNLANTGAFGFQTPIYEDMGFLKKGANPSASPSQG
ncbi:MULTISPECIES: ABC transporter family substrate-binding protein [unclassified Streptomyces]|uniref:ABC transporter family substrate-binding protein n=1 Tax=unclassified Streptomyces TaxID=2593676 RepID=UPI002E811328|nr:ABC transporter family substrate-binding protein [Streptomyces sp. NBC_00589]WTI36516.1 ABC transporter family substrate-binding protein [Streptomyces sp. NBC_00775]WUB29808.1 ABC transporter family substrate-binding protein [Streptomyces sp. NBC_00589]